MAETVEGSFEDIVPIKIGIKCVNVFRDHPRCHGWKAIRRVAVVVARQRWAAVEWLGRREQRRHRWKPPRQLAQRAQTLAPERPPAPSTSPIARAQGNSGASARRSVAAACWLHWKSTAAWSLSDTNSSGKCRLCNHTYSHSSILYTETVSIKPLDVAWEHRPCMVVMVILQ